MNEIIETRYDCVDQMVAAKICPDYITIDIAHGHADSVKSMIGSMLAGHEESLGQMVEVDGKLYKKYYGSASDFNKGEYKHVEGKRILEPIFG